MLLTEFGSIVQKGKFSAGTVHLVSVLKSVLLPTFGSPTIPICKYFFFIRSLVFRKSEHEEEEEEGHERVLVQLAGGKSANIQTVDQRD